MPDWNGLIRRRIAPLTLEPTREPELVEELGQHLDDRYQELLARGVAPAVAEAEVAAEHLDEAALRRALGPIEPVAKGRPVLGGGRGGRLAGLASDFWFAARSLRRSPGLVIVVLVTLAIGIGANVTIFSVVNVMLLRPLPYPDADRLVSFWGTAPEKGLPVVNYPDALYDYYRKRAQTITPLAFYSPTGITLSQAGQPQRIKGASVTIDFFRALGAVPLYGRTFLPEESVHRANLVAVLSYGLWQRRFAGDPGIVGQSIRVDDVGATVVGVMPRGFDFPQRSELWTPIGIDPTSINCWCYDAIGRLAPGRVPTDLVREIDALNGDFWAEREGRPRPAPAAAAARPGTIVVPLARQLVGDLRTPVLVLLTAVGMVLLIACANLASLLLVRAVGRSREIAVRSALGASPGRIVRQLATECGLLSVGGALAGLLLGRIGIGMVERLVVDRVSFLDRVPLDPTVLAFTVSVTLVTVMVFGVGPAIQGARFALAPVLKDGARGTDGRSSRRLNDGFVVGQLALSVVLLVGAGLLLRSFRNLRAIDPGFEAEQVVVGRVSIPWTGYQEMSQVRRLAARLLERVRALPGVLSAGVSSTAPFGANNQQELLVEGQVPAGNDPIPVASVRRVSVGYFETVATRLVEGRTFEESDRDSLHLVAIIDESLALRYWPAGNAVGGRISTGGRESPSWRTVIGVVASIRHQDLTKPPDYYVYQPLSQGFTWTLDLVVRATMPVAATGRALQAAMASVDPNLPLFDVHTLEEAVDHSLSTRKLTNALLLGFSLVALLLAAVGIYGVMTRMVLARTREFGVRLALGATPAAVRGLVLRQGVGLVVVGLLIGLGGALGLSRLLRSLLFEVEPFDPITFMAAPVLLAFVATAACYLPARRATGSDPLAAIRAE